MPLRDWLAVLAELARLSVLMALLAMATYFADCGLYGGAAVLFLVTGILGLLMFGCGSKKPTGPARDQD